MRIQNKFLTLIRQALPPTIVVTVIFFVCYYFFGMENTMIAPFVTLTVLRCRSMCSRYECMMKNFAVFAVMAVLAYFAVKGELLCICLNAAALFWIADLLIDEYNPTNYFPAGMALIFFQIAPVGTPAALANRLLALLASFLLVMFSLLIYSRTLPRRSSIRELVGEGFAICERLITFCHETRTASAKELEREEELHRALCRINAQCSSEIYAYNRASIRVRGKINWYCRFILFFQVLNDLTEKRQEGDNMAQAEALLSTFRQCFDTHSPGADYRRLNFRIMRPDLRNVRLRFALRQVIVLTPCLAFAFTSGLENAYWLVISVFFMMIPFTDDTKKRVRQRVLGTIAGILVCFVLFTLFKGFAARTVIMTVANFFIYASNGYAATVASITCSALALQTIDASVTTVLFERLIYTLAGALIALVANRFIFPIRVRLQLRYLIELLHEIRDEMTAITERYEVGTWKRRKEIDQRIIKSYLLSERLKTLHESLPEEEQLINYEKLRRRQMQFLAEYLSRYLIDD